MASLASKPQVDVTFVALHNFKAKLDTDLAARKGEEFFVIRVTDGWAYVESKMTGRRGQVPMNYLGKKVNGKWFFGALSGTEAQNILMTPPNIPGSFLVRESSHRSCGFSLSVRDLYDVKHWEIHKQISGLFYTKAHGRSFRSLDELVVQYSSKRDEISLLLVKPCIAVEDFKRLEISPHRIKFGKLIGEGSFGTVREGLLDSFPVAIKEHKIAQGTEKEFLNEAKILQHLRHTNIIGLRGLCTTQEPVYIVLDKANLGSLFDYLHERSNVRFIDLRIQAQFATQIVSAMDYIIAKRIIHRDLASRNVLVDTTTHVKLGDFSLARQLDFSGNYHAQDEEPYPVKWTDPEAAIKSVFTAKSEIWSFGIFLYELFSMGDEPYPDIAIRNVITRVSEGYRMERHPRCDPSVFLIMLRCWHKNPLLRPTFAELSDRLSVFV